MAYITLNLNKLKDNYEYLDQLFKQNHIEKLRPCPHFGEWIMCVALHQIKSCCRN